MSKKMEVKFEADFIKVRDPELKIEIQAPHPGDEQKAEKEAERLKKRMPNQNPNP